MCEGVCEKQSERARERAGLFVFQSFPPSDADTITFLQVWPEMSLKKLFC